MPQQPRDQTDPQPEEIRIDEGGAARREWEKEEEKRRDLEAKRKAREEREKHDHQVVVGDEITGVVRRGSEIGTGYEDGSADGFGGVSTPTVEKDGDRTTINWRTSRK